ncbi:MAG: hypothetical protein A3K19_09950 [Lentisphaerae bacterium RIFOXYB12_FULL_65_16]|nr:MAG: hypothetical protein A3K18_00685 [Lentisphaerae bacterium RIFOXYA12_64_32]OGV91275.1 MAG: hypothetical protein A3K19_09950 [Lentisphaerae bacterium RIFOXYB12_FULL_65_16]
MPTEFDLQYPHGRGNRAAVASVRAIQDRLVAWELGRDYYDGDRRHGYGGFRYDGRWRGIIPRLAERHGLTSQSRVLDVGCKKGFFLHDLCELIPGIQVTGVENHPYPLAEAMPSVKPRLLFAPYEKLPFPDASFDFVFAYAAIYMLNLGGVVAALREVQRVGAGRSFVTVGAYRTDEERRCLQDWTLLGTTVLHVDEWLEVFRYASYTGDYSFTTAATLGLAVGD